MFDTYDIIITYKNYNYVCFTYRQLLTDIDKHINYIVFCNIRLLYRLL